MAELNPTPAVCSIFFVLVKYKIRFSMYKHYFFFAWKLKEVASKVPELREKFHAKYQSEIASGKFDERDIQRFNSDDAYARCFLRTMKVIISTITGIDSLWWSYCIIIFIWSI